MCLSMNEDGVDQTLQCCFMGEFSKRELLLDDFLRDFAAHLLPLLRPVSLEVALRSCDTALIHYTPAPMA
jgi:hypothetical protein